jgi:hypothetical protein
MLTSATLDSDPVGPGEVIIPERFRPPEENAVGGNAGTLYFTPQDENTSVTCLFLYNTSTSGATVDLDTFTLDGTPYIDTSVVVPAGELVRVCSDEVDSLSGTWQDVVLVNFTTSSTWARMVLPPGVMAEGYVAWNGANPYDPLAVVPTLELRFANNLIFLSGYEIGDTSEWSYSSP